MQHEHDVSKSNVKIRFYRGVKGEKTIVNIVFKVVEKTRREKKTYSRSVKEVKVLCGFSILPIELC